MDALQVGSVGQLGVSGQDVFLELIRLAERLLAVITHIQVLLQVTISSCSFLPTIPLTPQCKVLSVLAVSLPESERGQDLRMHKVSYDHNKVGLPPFMKIYQLFTCMWLCSDEVEEKPRLHTLHLNGLLELEVNTKRQS